MKKEISRDEFLKKRAERQRKIRKRRLKAFFLIFTVLILCIGIVLSLTVLFPIKKISATGSKIYSEEQILKISGISLEDNLFAVSEGKTEKILKANLPYIESVIFERNIPDNLKIKVKDAVEFACYNINGRYYKVSSSGWVLSKESEASTDILNINADKVKCKVGSQIVFENEETKPLIDSIILSLKENKIDTQLIDVTNDIKINLYVENRFNVDLGSPNYITEKINHLNGMIQGIPEEYKGKIDLSMWTNDNRKAPFRKENN